MKRLLIPLLLFASCAKAPEPLPSHLTPEYAITFSPWTWAECLPSAAGYDCEGEKPSWAIYQEKGIISWTYESEGERWLIFDGYNTWKVYETLYCINAAGERTGKSGMVGFRNIPFAHHPLTGELSEYDDFGPVSGEQFTIYGVISRDGRVLPVAW